MLEIHSEPETGWSNIIASTNISFSRWKKRLDWLNIWVQYFIKPRRILINCVIKYWLPWTIFITMYVKHMTLHGDLWCLLIFSSDEALIYWFTKRIASHMSSKYKRYKAKHSLITNTLDTLDFILIPPIWCYNYYKTWNLLKLLFVLFDSLSKCFILWK